MWSSVDGCFKVLDFSLTFHKEDSDLHQIQTKGYQAPEAAEWNTYKEEVRARQNSRLSRSPLDRYMYDNIDNCSSKSAGRGSCRARTRI